MTNSNAMLTINDLKIGMKVSESSLRSIKGFYITLIDSVREGDDIIGTIAYIGKRLNRKSDKISRLSKDVCAIYNSAEDIDGEVTYDE